MPENLMAQQDVLVFDIESWSNRLVSIPFRLPSDHISFREENSCAYASSNLSEGWVEKSWQNRAYKGNS
jgi:hypothetical protein